MEGSMEGWHCCWANTWIFFCRWLHCWWKVWVQWESSRSFWRWLINSMVRLNIMWMIPVHMMRGQRGGRVCVEEGLVFDVHVDGLVFFISIDDMFRGVMMAPIWQSISWREQHQCPQSPICVHRRVCQTRWKNGSTWQARRDQCCPTWQQ